MPRCFCHPWERLATLELRTIAFLFIKAAANIQDSAAQLFTLYNPLHGVIAQTSVTHKTIGKRKNKEKKLFSLQGCFGNRGHMIDVREKSGKYLPFHHLSSDLRFQLRWSPEALLRAEKVGRWGDVSPVLLVSIHVRRRLELGAGWGCSLN